LGGVNIGNCHPAVLLHSKSYWGQSYGTFN
jgi:hypothetical protein